MREETSSSEIIIAINTTLILIRLIERVNPKTSSRVVWAASAKSVKVWIVFKYTVPI